MQKLDAAMSLLNEARSRASFPTPPLTVDYVMSGASAEVRLSAMLIASLLEQGHTPCQRDPDIVTVNRAARRLRHFAVDGDEPCDFITPSRLAQSPAGVALSWFDGVDEGNA